MNKSYYWRKHTFRIIRNALFFFLLTLFFVRAAAGQDKYIFEKPEMGSPFTITIFCADSIRAAEAARQAFARADSLNNALSDYLPGSELNKLSASAGQGRYVPVSPPLFNIISRSLEAAKLSDGKFDITIGPVVQLWRKARQTKILPSPASIDSARQKTGYRLVILDTVNHAILLKKAGMKLDLGGLGKGFVAAEALAVLKRSGFERAMVNAGGKIVTGLPPEGTSGWIIGINAPQEKDEYLSILLALKEMSVATSGDIYQFVEFNNKRYSHIVDPATGVGITRRRNVTAIAKDGTTADWLSTACSVLSFRKSRKLIRKIPGAALLVTEIKKGKIRQRSSVNFRNYQLNP